MQKLKYILKTLGWALLSALAITIAVSLATYGRPSHPHQILPDYMVYAIFFLGSAGILALIVAPIFAFTKQWPAHWLGLTTAAIGAAAGFLLIFSV